MRVHLIVEQDDGTLMGLSSEAALVEIDRETDLADVTFGPARYTVPGRTTTTLTLQLFDYTVFRPHERPWEPAHRLYGRPALGATP